MSDRSIPLELAEVILEPKNVDKVLYIMRNPLRELLQLQMEQFETFTSAIVAGQGNPEDTLYALLYALFERADDPIKVLQILIKGTYFEKMHRK